MRFSPYDLRKSHSFIVTWYDGIGNSIIVILIIIIIGKNNL